MPLPESSVSWWMVFSAIGVIAAIAFLVPWFLTDVLRVPRAAYLSALMLMTGGLTFGYLAWSGTDGMAFVSRYWPWGVLGALVSGAITARAIRAAAGRRGLPVPVGRSRSRLAGALLWEGVFYGAAGGVLLSALPVLVAWQGFHLLGWTETTAGALGSGILVVGASALVIWIHHLGYREFRRTRMIVLPIIACGVLSLAYLITRGAVAPVGGHFLTHAGMEVRGVPMPPYSKGLMEPSPEVELAAA